jgi:hypothetical protein
MYYGEMQSLECSFSYELCLHPLALVLSRNITTYWPKKKLIPTMTGQEDSVLQITVMVCYLCALCTDGKPQEKSFI